MTFEDTRTILKIVKSEWPQSFKGISREDAEAKLNLWAEMFKDDPVELVGAAVKALIAAGGREFAPQIGTIKDQMRMLIEPNAMTEAEAWAVVKKAVCRSGYNSVAEYAKLPPLIQKLVGSSNQLRDWSQMDIDTLDSVIGSNFQRSYKVSAKKERDYAAIPADIKAVIAPIADRFRLEGSKTYQERPETARDGLAAVGAGKYTSGERNGAQQLTDGKAGG